MDQATSSPIRWFYESVHCFRMQLFFFLSGLFTMLLWRRRGGSALFEQRFQRIVVPMLLAYVTILPLLSWISTKATDDTIRTVLTNLTSTSLVQAICNQQREERHRRIEPPARESDEHGKLTFEQGSGTLRGEQARESLPEASRAAFSPRGASQRLLRRAPAWSWNFVFLCLPAETTQPRRRPG
jgi:hypothetical protein